MTLLVDRDPEFTRFKAAWVTYQHVQADRSETGGADGPRSYLQTAKQPSTADLHAAAVELDAAREAFLAAPRL